MWAQVVVVREVVAQALACLAQLLRLHALAVCAGAILLLLPLGGIPFTNTLPALVVVFGTLGMLERDGVAVAAAYVLLLATFVYFAAFAGVAFEVTQRLLRAWSG